MVKYKVLMSKLMSNLFIRTILCIVLMMFGAMFVRFSNSMTTFAQNIDVSEINKQKAFSNSQNNNDVIFINLNEKDNYVSAKDMFEQIYNQASVQEFVEVESLENQYITACENNSNEYPENWVNEFNKKIIVLQNIFQSGKYWNHMGQDATNPEETNNIFSVTDIPCNHYQNGEAYCNAHYGKSDEIYPYKATCSQCRGFASLLSDLIFGEDAPVRYFEDYDELRIGDQARIDGDYHSVFIIDKTDDYVIVAECNSDLQTCQINWGRKILRENMAGWYISRWR